jgi:hypothetical protein
LGELLLNFGTAKIRKIIEYEIVLRYFFTYFRQAKSKLNIRLFSDLTHLVENFFARFSTGPEAPGKRPEIEGLRLAGGVPAGF